uniref:Uncharacterized protein n=1 Tax=Arundo donax TaxID=35708 RepID=A0A0A8ZQ84_ARUDO
MPAVPLCSMRPTSDVVLSDSH